MKTVAMPIDGSLKIPVLEYTSVIEQAKEDMRYCTTAEKFERDLRDLLENGYTPVSLSEYASFREGGGSCPEKAFAVVFSGGYQKRRKTPTFRYGDIRHNKFLENSCTR